MSEPSHELSEFEQLLALKAENAKLKDTNRRLHRRCQEAESAAGEFADWKQIGSEQKTGRYFPALMAFANRKFAEANEKLIKFAREFIKTECWGYAPEIDGSDVQEVAEKMGLIEEYPATQQDCIDFSEGEFEVGDPIYKFTDLLKEPTDETRTESS